MIHQRRASVPVAVGLLAAALLLLALIQVVRGAVVAGESRHADLAEWHAVNWRCKALPDRREAEACLRLNRPVAMASVLPMPGRPAAAGAAAAPP